MATMVLESTPVQVGRLLRSWQKFIDDYRRRQPAADLSDPVLIEKLNITWLREERNEAKGQPSRDG